MEGREQKNTIVNLNSIDKTGLVGVFRHDILLWRIECVLVGE